MSGIQSPTAPVEAAPPPAPLPHAPWPALSARERQLRQVLDAGLLQRSALARCLPVLLVLLDWRGAPQALRAWLPTRAGDFTTSDLAALLHGLGYQLSKRSGGPAAADWPLGTLATDGSRAWVRLETTDGAVAWLDGAHVCGPGEGPPPNARIHTVALDPECPPLETPQPAWTEHWLRRAWRGGSHLAFASVVLNVLLLALSLFTMEVYNEVIPSGATATLWSLGGLAMLATLGASALRLWRARLMLHSGAVAGHELNVAVLRKTLAQPLDLVGRIGAGTQLSRLRMLDSVRDFLAGSSGISLFDYPCAVIFLSVIVALGGWIALVPLLGLLAYAVAAWAVQPWLRGVVARSGAVSLKLQDVVGQLAQQLRGLRGSPPGEQGAARLQALAQEVALANRDFARVNGGIQALALAISQMTVLATMVAGVALVMHQAMSAGGLIAAMMLIWRITSPAQQLFMAGVNLKQVRDSLAQVDRLMAALGEGAAVAGLPLPALHPRLTLDKAYLRLSADREAQLAGVSVDIEPGLRVAVVGPNGAGKSVLLRAVAGLHTLQGGRVLIDGHDTRQFDPVALRGWMGFLGQAPDGLPLNLADTVRLGRAAATEADVAVLFEKLLGPAWWRFFGAVDAEGALRTELPPWGGDAATRRRQRAAAMARALLGDPPLVLLDEPLFDHDPELEAGLLRCLDAMRGRSTVLVATHRPDLIQRCDRVLVLDHGAMLHYGPVALPPAETPKETPA